ncbi:MAG: PTS galactosamine/N-acetylgalactosamine transporter subunit IIA [Tissierellales bacterium]|jgi:PTS system N-acetylgalactosamine-specific IIA component|nr:PTS galactosamine/N-acetylgalactosamine transporter subunit IIA [Tissierellales bacterium]
MVGIIITGHGKFAEGIVSALEVIVGSQPQISTVNFLETDGTDELKAKLEESVKKVQTGDGVMIFSDLVGGSPFKTSAMLSVEDSSIKVMGGTSIQSIMEILFMRDENIDDISKRALLAAQKSAQLFEVNKKQKEISEEGI